MSVTLTDWNNAGSAYASAATAFIAAYVALKATELKLNAEGIALTGGRLGSETNSIDLIPLRHPQFAPNIDTPRLADQIVAKISQL
jgi:hypothetical protein